MDVGLGETGLTNNVMVVSAFSEDFIDDFKGVDLNQGIFHT